MCGICELTQNLCELLRYDDDRYGDDYGENDREYRRPTRRSFRSRFYDDEDEEDDRYYQEERRRRRSPNGRRLSDDYEGSNSDLRRPSRQDRPPHHVKYAEERRSYDDRPHYRAQNNEDDVSLKSLYSTNTFCFS